MMAVSIPVYTVKGLFTTCVPQFLEHAAGIHPPDTGSNVRTSPAGGRPFSSPYSLAVCVSPYQHRDKTEVASQNTCYALSRGRGFVRIIYAWGPITRFFTNIYTYIHTYIHTFAQISTPHCTIISLASCLAIMALICTFRKRSNLQHHRLEQVS